MKENLRTHCKSPALISGTPITNYAGKEMQKKSQPKPHLQEKDEKKGPEGPFLTLDYGKP
ncbi:hypothetical protein [Comamonas endophytica]|uniref:Uncharacterized protein n=1 Tax=Comamonas endophytica TaxID=2949090 RepID=A0ABY6G5L0_9BURK|nr:MULTISPECIES: hypothetical protein [unclassified Acidovorax]MCD2512370.1 hypothetical protein [Acidovorax sp. D4N7]UYG50181.1 hypothetical protein M9799_08595 [Acidovorax sp. 5MLIR]